MSNFFFVFPNQMSAGTESTPAEPTSSQAICAICLNALTTDDTFTLPCNNEHTFHTVCIMELFRRGDPKCPLCRDVPDEIRQDDDNEDYTAFFLMMQREWRRIQQWRNRIARRHEDVRRIRQKFWESRKNVNHLQREYNKKLNRRLRENIRNVHRLMRPDKDALSSAIEKMNRDEREFDAAVYNRR